MSHDIAAAWIPPAERLDDLVRRPWQPIDLTDVLSGTYKPPEPSVGRRSDGVPLLYAAKVHTLSGESESLKTWLAVSLCGDELIAGEHVVYLDFEDDEGGIVSRFLAIQIEAPTLAERLHYVRPTAPLGTGINLDDLTRLVADRQPSLVVIDGVTEAMDLHDLDPLNNKEIARVGRILPRRIADLGPAVLCLDHVVKSSENRGRYALGGVHKLNGLDGAALIVENRTPAGIGLTGRSTIKIAKDRPGQLRRHALPSSGGMFWLGDLVVTSHDERFLEVEVTPPHDLDPDFRPTVLMTRVAEALGKHGPLAQRRVIAAVQGKTDSIRQALDYLILDGYVSDKSPHGLLRPYPEGGDAP